VCPGVIACLERRLAECHIGQNGRRKDEKSRNYSERDAPCQMAGRGN
jgi:hypothetical protein